MRRTLKKIIYGLFYLSLVALLALFVWRQIVAVPPTCSDAIQNQNETGVDCGGVCVPCEITHLLPLQSLSPYRIFALSNGRAVLMFAVANPNRAYHATHFSYHIAVFDKAGTRVEQLDGADSLYAGATKYVIESRVGVRASAIGSVAITVDDPSWLPVAERAAPALALSGITTESLPTGTIRVHGVATNKGSNEARDVAVLAIAYDRYGAKLFAAESVLTSLAGFESTPFSILFPVDAIFQNVDAAKTEVFISSK